MTEQSETPFLGVSPLCGVNFAVRGADEAQVTAATKQVPVEAYLDEDYGVLTYDVKVLDSEGDPALVRVDRRSGRAWFFDGETWVAVIEPDAG